MTPTPDPVDALDAEGLEDCSAAETSAFEAWAKANGYSLGPHPLHFLFLDPKTYAARQGWKAALAYARTALEAAAPRRDGWREIDDQAKSGRRVLLCNPGTGEVVVGYWRKGPLPWVSDDGWSSEGCFTLYQSFPSPPSSAPLPPAP